MIVTVTPNPALDLTWRVPRLEHGESHRAAAAAVRAGGKGLNVARVAHSFGFRTLAVAPAGTDGGTSAEFRTELDASRLPHTLVPTIAPIRRSLTIVDESTGQATVVNEEGTALPPELVAELIAVTTDAATGAAVVVVSGSLPPDSPAHLIDHLVAAARGAGALTIVDTSGGALLAAARAKADVLKPNRTELAEATGIADPVSGGRSLVAAGARCVVVSLGEEGLLLVDGDATWHARLDHVLSGNPTGAGDAAVAALACSMIDRALPWEDAPRVLTRAVAWSAAAVLAPLAGTVHARHDALRERVVVTRVAEVSHTGGSL